MASDEADLERLLAELGGSTSSPIPPGPEATTRPRQRGQCAPTSGYEGRAVARPASGTNGALDDDDLEASLAEMERALSSGHSRPAPPRDTPIARSMSEDRRLRHDVQERTGAAAYAPRGGRPAPAPSSAHSSVDALLALTVPSPDAAPKAGPGRRTASASASGASRGAATGEVPRAGARGRPASIAARGGVPSTAAAARGSGGEGPGSVRCAALFIGGTALPMGQNKSASRFAGQVRCCNRMRCVECDMAVEVFDGQRWRGAATGEHSAGHTVSRPVSAASDSDAESPTVPVTPGGGVAPGSLGYMFFREHHPDREELRKGLEAAPGWRAYCCQCTWRAAGPAGGAAVAGFGSSAGSGAEQLRSAGGGTGPGAGAARGCGGGRSWRCGGH